MKPSNYLYIATVALLVGAYTFAYAQYPYSQYSGASRFVPPPSNGITEAEYRRLMRLHVLRESESAGQVPAYIMRDDEPRRSVIVPVIVPVSDSLNDLNDLTVETLTAEEIIVNGPIQGETGQFGENSVHIGGGKKGVINYIKSVGLSSINSLRIMIGTTQENALEMVRILANGNVGIGTGNPLNVLHVHRPSSSVSGNVIRMTSGMTGETANDGSVISLDGSGLFFRNYEQGRIGFFVNDVPIGSTSGEFFEALIINNNGNVGIGTPNPQSRLHLFEWRMGEHLEKIFRMQTPSVHSSFGVRNSSLIISARQMTSPSTIGGINFETIAQDGTYLNPLTISNNGQVQVNKEFCLPDGSSVGGLKMACFKSVCPSANGQWTLSKDTTCSGAPVTGAPSLSLATSLNNVPARYRVMGSTDNTDNRGNAVYRLLVTASGSENVKLTQIVFTDTIVNNLPNITSFTAFELYDGETKIAGPVNAVLSGLSPSKITFSLGSSYEISQGSPKTLTLRADVPAFVSGGAVSGSEHVFGISSTDDVAAFGSLSGLRATISGTPSGTLQTVYRTNLFLTSASTAPTTGRVRKENDDIGTLNFRADSADDVTVRSVTIKLSGLHILSPGPTSTVSLIDANTNIVLGAQTCTPGAGSSCSVTFTPSLHIMRGTSKVVKLRVNSLKFSNAADAFDSLSATIGTKNASDVLWSEGTSTTNISLEPIQTPISNINISYQ